MSPRSAILLAVASLLLSAAPGRASSRTLSLASAVEVASDGVFLDQILRLTPPAEVPHVRVSPAPPFGQTALLTRTEVSDWLRSHAPDLLVTNWAGLDRTRISRRSRTLEETELRDLLRLSLQDGYVKEKGELELRFGRSLSPVRIPDEPLTLRLVDLPATGPSAHFILRFELLAGEERVGSWQVAAMAKIYRDIPVASAPLRRGQLLAAAPITLERRDVLALRDSPGAFALDDPSLELTEGIAAGQPVLARSVRPRPVVVRGQLADGVVEDGGLVITLKVEILQDGLPGQIIRVRNPRTRRELVAKVLNEQTVSIPR